MKLQDFLVGDYQIEIYPHSVKFFQNGKFCGIVSRVNRMDTLQSRTKFDVVKSLCKNGFSNNASTQKNFIIEGKAIYFVKNNKLYFLTNF